jgi:hypothetical protein
MESEEEDAGQKLKNLKRIDKDTVNSLLISMITRKRFLYTFKDMVLYVIRCFCIRDLQSARKKNPKAARKHIYLAKAEDKLTHELDIMTLIKSVRNLRLISQVILSQRNKMLLRFQKQNLLETSESGSDSDHNAYDTLKLMEHRNPVVRLMIYGKLKKMVTSYIGDKMKDKDKNLIRGVFMSKINDFDEEEQDRKQNQTLLSRLIGEIEGPGDRERTANGSPPRELNGPGQKMEAIVKDEEEIQKDIDTGLKKADKDQSN